MNGQSRYTEILEGALDYIETNIFSPLSTVSIASAVGFSEYHFQRIFAALVGESAAEYVRKRRLSEAALRLRESNISITDIAILCQFSSQEAFARSFKQMFGQTPGQYRQGDSSQQRLLIPKADLSTILDMRQGRTIKPTLIERQSEKAVGMGGSFPPKSTIQINALWNRFVKRQDEIQDKKGGYALGICSLRHPRIPKEKGHAFVYIAAMPVESTVNVPPDMVAAELLSGRYAVFPYKGKLSDFQHTIDYIWGTWVPSREYELRDAPDFEIYEDHRFSKETLAGEVEIYIPIV